MGDPVTGYVVSFVISAALSYVSQSIQKRKLEQAKEEQRNAIEQSKKVLVTANTRSTSESLKLIYGKYRVGGNDVYIGTPEKKILWFVQTIGEGEINGISKVNDIDQVFIDKKIYTEINSEDTTKTLVDYELFTGSNTQSLTDSGSALMTEFLDSFPDYEDNLRNTAFMIWKFQYKDGVFRGNPQREVVIEGKVVYDFRDDTWKWSDNPVLCLYDFMTNGLYGVGLSSTKIDIDSWTIAADYCDTKNFTLNYVSNVYEKNWDDIQNNILQTFRGGFTEYDDVLYLRVMDLNEETSIMDITDEHIIQDANGKSSVHISKPGLFDYPKLIKLVYYDEEKDWAQDSFFIGEEDNPFDTVTFEGVSNATQVGILGNYYIERQRLNRILNVTCRDECIKLEPYDIVTFTCSSLFISNQTMRVVSTEITSENNVNLSLQYEQFTLYNDTFDVGTDQIYNSSLPDRRTPSTTSNVTAEEETYYYRQRSLTRLNISFDIDEGDIWFDHVEVWLSTSGSDESSYRHWGDVVNDFSIDPVEEGTKYYVALKTVNIWGIKQTFNQANKVTKNIIGRSLTHPPSPNPLLAIPADGSLGLKSTKINDPDIFTYEIRLGDAWNGGVYLASNETPNWFIKPVRPGNFTFWLDTLGTNGLYGETPVYAYAGITLPKGWTSAYNFTDDYTDDTNGQVFDNTEHVTYTADDYLKCSHSGGDTTGVYISEVFDVGVGNTDTFYAYVDTEFSTVGGGTTWAELWGDGTNVNEAWSYQDVSRQWSDILRLEVAPHPIITIYYKELSGDSWSEINNAEIFAGVIYARYFKVQIQIIDPADAIYLYVKNYTLRLYN